MLKKNQNNAVTPVPITSEKPMDDNSFKLFLLFIGILVCSPENYSILKIISFSYLNITDDD